MVGLYIYDARDNRVSATKPDGVVLTSVYDRLSRLVSLSGGDVSRDYAYDAQSNLTAANDRLIGPDALGGEIGLVFDYDGENRLSETTVSGLFAPGTTANRFAYAYDALDRRATLTDSFGGTSGYAYDPVDRLTELTTPQGEAFTQTYDLAGRMLIRRAPNVVETVRSFETDTGRLATQRHALIGAVVNDFGYDRRDNITAVTDARANLPPCSITRSIAPSAGSIRSGKRGTSPTTRETTALPTAW